jgi:tetratricopeptide (TPR) repeat protein/tRNA A-37 threonylcarbamoyl transferase component Bud32
MSDTLDRVKVALHGRYAVEREIGRGGMATVYLAEDLKHDRKVAIKVLDPEIAAVLGAERFLQEIRLTANLQHPHIVALYDSGEADGVLYYVMPYVEGESLRDRLNREGKIPVREAVRITIDVLAALEYAHRRDIVHRDIKPENILLHEGAVLVADFGIARATAAAGGTRLTSVGMAVGTPAYMSPEQASGATDADARSDLYGVGCVLYEMLAGTPPFHADTAQKVLSQQVVGTPAPLNTVSAEVPTELTAVVDRVLAKAPEDRPQTARELSELLDQAAMTGAAPTVGSGAWFVDELLRPRVLGVLGGYLALTVAAIAATKWLAGKYLLSSQLPWLVGVALLALLPAVGIVAWYRKGGIHRRSWVRVAGLGIPANVIAAAALLFVLFGKADMGSATTMVSVRNELGDLINRAIPKSEYRRRVALFPVDNQSGDSALDWVQYAVPLAVSVDLGQDPFVRVLSPAEFRDQLEEAGKPEGLDMPLALKRRVASRVFMQYFTAGQITREAGQLVLTIGLYDTERASLVAQRTYQGDDVLGMVDAISVQLRQDLGIPSGAMESAPDLPATELFTASRPAFRAYVDGMTAAALDRRLEDAAARLAVAVGADESFALANLARYGTLTQLGRSAEAEQALGQVMEHSYRLNERTQLQAKLVYYFLVRQDAEKAMAVATMWTELYPEDPDGHMQRAGLLQLRNDLVGVIDEMQQVIALDSNQYDLLRTVGSLYSSRGVYDTAVTYLEAYLEREPENPEGYLDLAGVALTQAAFDRSAELYDRALVLDARNALALKGLGDVAAGSGEFELAAERYDEALAEARTAAQRATILSAMADVLAVQGRIRDALRYQQRSFDAQEEAVGPFQTDQMRVGSAGLYARGGMAKEALDSVRAIEGRLGAAFGSLAALGYLSIALEIDSIPLLEEAIESTEALIVQFGIDAVRPVVLRARARVLESRGQCREALPLYEEAIPLAPTVRGFEIDIGRCLGVIGRFDDAEGRLRVLTQKWPAIPQANYELAVVAAARGDTAAARAELDRALAIWRNADPGFRPARKAREFAHALGVSGGP